MCAWSMGGDDWPSSGVRYGTWRQTFLTRHPIKILDSIPFGLSTPLCSTRGGRKVRSDDPNTRFHQKHIVSGGVGVWRTPRVLVLTCTWMLYLANGMGMSEFALSYGRTKKGGEGDEGWKNAAQTLGPVACRRAAKGPIDERRKVQVRYCMLSQAYE